MIIGLDLSVTNTGYCVIDYNGGLVDFGTVKTKLKGPDRWHEILSKLSHVFEEHHPEIAIIEGLGFASHRVAISAELSSLVRYQIYSWGISYKMVPPTTLKKLITGRGNANKIEMIAAVRAIYGIEFEDDHQCDAFCLAILEQEGKLEARGIYDYKAEEGASVFNGPGSSPGV